jgi:hypothetical protein
LFKTSIQLEEEISVPAPKISPGEGKPQPAPGTPPAKDGPTLISEVNPGTMTRHIEPNLEPEEEIAVVASLLDPDAN